MDECGLKKKGLSGHSGNVASKLKIKVTSALSTNKSADNFII